MRETWVQFLGLKIPWRRDRLPTPVLLDFPCGSAGKESACNAGDLGSIPGLGRSPGEGKGYPFQCSGLENSMDCIARGVRKSWTRLGFPALQVDSLPTELSGKPVTWESCLICVEISFLTYEVCHLGKSTQLV